MHGRMRPVHLPKLVAARNSLPNSSDDSLAANPVASHNSSDSFTSASSECSTPLSPTFSFRGHSRYASSNSSLASTPPTHDIVAVAASSTNKLPDLREEPMEREDGFVMIDADPEDLPCLCDVDDCAHQVPSDILNMSNQDYDLSDGFLGDDGDIVSQPLPKRRRSGESPSSSLATRLGNRFPSLSRRLKERKRTSIPGISPTCTATPSRAPSSRSSSLTGSLVPPLDRSEIQLPLTPARSVSEFHTEPTPSTPSSPLEVDTLQANASKEADDSHPLITTPLLPPIMVDLRSSSETPVQSPLQSPTVADSSATISKNNSPFGTPQCPGMPTPPLSSKPSISSFKKFRPGHMVPSSEIPPIMIADPQDEWSMKLGHANFTIEPEPYIPEICDAAACRQLVSDWEKARFNYAKHQVRTQEHFGVTSKTYKLTEEKWAEIDAQWRSNNDIAMARAAVVGLGPSSSTPNEPAPVATTALSTDPKSEGKFPKRGDEDIVGPMIQIASQTSPKSSKRAAFFKFFSGIKSPSAFLGRSSLGMRTSR